MSHSLFPGSSGTPKALAGTEMLRLIEDYDWSSTKVGPIETWPHAYRVTTRLMLASGLPMVMLMGQSGVLIYNDAYAIFAGGRHPAILGKDVAIAWPEIADYNLEILREVLDGNKVTKRGQLLQLNRNGVDEDVWLDLEYSPVLDGAGNAIGELVVFSVISERVRAEKALEKSEESLAFALSATGMVGVWDWDVVNDIVTSDPNFARMFGVDPDVASSGAPIAAFVEGVHPDDQELLTASIASSLETGAEFRQEYRLRHADGSVTWVLALARPVYDADRRAIRLPGIAVDITQQKAQETALKESEAKFRAIADTLPQMLWSTLPDGYHDYYNARWYEFTGVTPGSTDGEEWNGVFHPDDQERAWKIWRHSLETGDPYRIEYRLRHRSGAYRWTLGQALPIVDEDGKILRWFGSITDIHEDKLAAEEREIVAQELNHRIKNIFSVINGLVSLSGRAHPELKPLTDDLRARIAALGSAHDMVRHNEGWSAGEGNSLRMLLDRLLAPYRRGAEDRIEISGDDCQIDDRAATPLALLFHELATNAAKYGALSTQAGRLDINVGLDGAYVVIDWHESGLEIRTTQPTMGFGSRLIGLALETQLSGAFQRSWTDEGMVARIRIPLASLTRPGRPGTA